MRKKQPLFESDMDEFSDFEEELQAPDPQPEEYPRPHNIDDLSPNIRGYILHLEEKIQMFSTDGLEGLYHALNYQLNNINKDLMDTQVSFKTKADKTYERFWKAMVDSKDVASNLLWLKKELNIVDKTRESKPTEEGKQYKGTPFENRK